MTSTAKRLRQRRLVERRGTSATVSDTGSAHLGVLSPELACFFDAMASHFPGHVMQRLMRPDGTVRYTYVSPGLTALGLDPTTILAAQTSPQDWIHPDDAARWRTALSVSAQALSTLDEEVRVIAGDGRVRWVRSIGNPRRLSNGDVVWDGIALDVTDKRDALDAMRLAKAAAEQAEAQKARLLASLLAVLDGLNTTLQAALSITPISERLARQTIAMAATATERAVALLKGARLADDEASEAPPDPRLAKLTKRQRAVLDLVGQGCSNREIAERLDLAEGTVKLHVAALLKSLGAQNRTQAAAVILQAR